TRPGPRSCSRSSTGRKTRSSAGGVSYTSTSYPATFTVSGPTSVSVCRSQLSSRSDIAPPAALDAEFDLTAASARVTLEHRLDNRLEERIDLLGGEPDEAFRVERAVQVDPGEGFVAGEA